MTMVVWLEESPGYGKSWWVTGMPFLMKIPRPSPRRRCRAIPRVPNGSCWGARNPVSAFMMLPLIHGESNCVNESRKNSIIPSECLSSHGLMITFGWWSTTSLARTRFSPFRSMTMAVVRTSLRWLPIQCVRVCE